MDNRDVRVSDNLNLDDPVDIQRNQLGLVGGSFGILALGLTWGNRVVTKGELTRQLDKFDDDFKSHINEVYLY